MGFSTNLQGRAAHEALLCRQEAELRLLTTMRGCLVNKIKCDRQYADALASVVVQGRKIEKTEDLVGSLVTQAWKNMLEEIENTAKLIKQNADMVESRSVEKLNSLYAEKRKGMKLYQEEHNRIAAQFSHVSLPPFSVNGVLCINNANAQAFAIWGTPRLLSRSLAQSSLPSPKAGDRQTFWSLRQKRRDQVALEYCFVSYERSQTSDTNATTHLKTSIIRHSLSNFLPPRIDYLSVAQVGSRDAQELLESAQKKNLPSSQQYLGGGWSEHNSVAGM
uniref:FCH domain-containing protein n=2 Tax=Timema TaxID=61471 RepID=A0A7R9E8B6_9NEOP|nr:unnamed protein product [Timema monikensis]